MAELLSCPVNHFGDAIVCHSMLSLSLSLERYLNELECFGNNIRNICIGQISTPIEAFGCKFMFFFWMIHRIGLGPKDFLLFILRAIELFLNEWNAIIRDRVMLNLRRVPENSPTFFSRERTNFYRSHASSDRFGPKKLLIVHLKVYRMVFEWINYAN